MPLKFHILALFVIGLIGSGPPVYGAIGAQKIELGNGMTILLLEDHTLPMLQVDLLVRAGSILDPANKSGLAYLTANLLEDGTESRTSKEIADAFDKMGTDFGVSPGVDYISFSTKLLKKDLGQGMELFSDILIHPQFPDRELSREKNELLSRLQDQKDDPETVASLAFDKAVFGEHPYHQPLAGDEISVKSIASEDLKSFYKSFYNPKNSILVLVGDLTPAEAKKVIEKHFGSWLPKALFTPKHPLPEKSMKKEIILIDKELAQTSVILGHLGISRNNPDYYPLQVMNYILGGGGFSSRMLANIRENKGLVYGLDSHFYPYFETGSFRVMFQTKNGSANDAISEVLSEIRKIQNERVSPDELQEAKDYLIGSYPLKMDTYSKLAGILISQEFYGLGLDYFDKYTVWIQKVTLEDIQRVARQYLDPDHFILVAVGKQSEAKIQSATDGGLGTGR
ncbi:MAG: insulinase family protein [Nitrospirae bacterium]|nr:insulinase family protein [Nitrospirota bacterium]